MSPRAALGGGSQARFHPSYEITLASTCDFHNYERKTKPLQIMKNIEGKETQTNEKPKQSKNLPSANKKNDPKQSTRSFNREIKHKGQMINT